MPRRATIFSRFSLRGGSSKSSYSPLRGESSTGSEKSDDTPRSSGYTETPAQWLSKSYKTVEDKPEGATEGYKCTDEANQTCLIKMGGEQEDRGTSEVISEDLACKLGKKVFELLPDAPKGLSNSIPETELLVINDKHFVKSVFLYRWNGLHTVETTGPNDATFNENKRERVKSKSAMNEIIAKLNDEQRKELCWLLAYRHVVGDKDGHSANFGLIYNEKDKKWHVGMIDLGLANRDIAERTVNNKALSHKGFVTHKLQRKASPNHLADYEELYKDPEFQKAADAMSTLCADPKYQQQMQSTISEVLGDAEQKFGAQAVEKYKTEWCKLDSSEADLATSLCDQYKTRSTDLARVTKELQDQKPKYKKSKIDPRVVASLPIEELEAAQQQVNHTANSSRFSIRMPAGLRQSIRNPGRKSARG